MAKKGAGRAPSPNLRVVVRGHVRAEKDYEVFDTDRQTAEREADKALKDLQRLEAQVKRDARRARGKR